ncbi:hypothetical protein DIPPA_05569 [Diplonema papillatum]|nr:hypothetical protein DIPPA_05569 [Diplonema papillatum]
MVHKTREETSATLSLFYNEEENDHIVTTKGRPSDAYELVLPSVGRVFKSATCLGDGMILPSSAADDSTHGMHQAQNKWIDNHVIVPDDWELTFSVLPTGVVNKPSALFSLYRIDEADHRVLSVGFSAKSRRLVVYTKDEVPVLSSTLILPEGRATLVHLRWVFGWLRLYIDRQEDCCKPLDNRKIHGVTSILWLGSRTQVAAKACISDISIQPSEPLTCRDVQLEVEEREGAVLDLPLRTIEAVVFARYGAGTSWKNVVSIVQSEIADGGLKLKVRDSTFKCPPAKEGSNSLVFGFIPMKKGLSREVCFRMLATAYLRHGAICCRWKPSKFSVPCFVAHNLAGPCTVLSTSLAHEHDVAIPPLFLLPLKSRPAVSIHSQKPNPQSTAKHTTPLYQMWNDSKKNHVLTPDPEPYLSAGYKVKFVEGHAYTKMLPSVLLAAVETYESHTTKDTCTVIDLSTLTRIRKLGGYTLKDTLGGFILPGTS